MDGSVDIVVDPSGSARMVYDEAFDARCLGSTSIRRGSEVEPTSDGQWIADLGRVGGPRLGPFNYRSEALEAEVSWLRRHWLVRDDPNIDFTSPNGDIP